MRVFTNEPGAVGNSIPINQAREPGVIDNRPQALVLGIFVRNQVLGYELVVELTKGKVEALLAVVINDNIGGSNRRT